MRKTEHVRPILLDWRIHHRSLITITRITRTGCSRPFMVSRHNVENGAWSASMVETWARAREVRAMELGGAGLVRPKLTAAMPAPEFYAS